MKSFNVQEFAKRVNTARKHRQISVTQMCKFARFDRSQFYRMSRGATKGVGCEILMKLAQVLGVSTDWLLGLSKEDEPEDGTPWCDPCRSYHPESTPHVQTGTWESTKTEIFKDNPPSEEEIQSAKTEIDRISSI